MGMTGGCGVAVDGCRMETEFAVFLDSSFPPLVFVSVFSWLLALLFLQKEKKATARRRRRRMQRRVPTNPPMMANPWLWFSKRVCSMRTLIIGLFIIDNFFKLLDFFHPPQDGRSHSCSTNPSDVHSLALPFPCAMLHSLCLFLV